MDITDDYFFGPMFEDEPSDEDRSSSDEDEQVRDVAAPKKYRQLKVPHYPKRDLHFMFHLPEEKLRRKQGRKQFWCLNNNRRLPKFVVSVQ